jgi:hypothetical protein
VQLAAPLSSALDLTSAGIAGDILFVRVAYCESGLKASFWSCKFRSGKDGYDEID